jgi:hypothetical protein
VAVYVGGGGGGGGSGGVDGAVWSGKTTVNVESMPGVNLHSTQELLNSPGNRVPHPLHSGVVNTGAAASTR